MHTTTILQPEICGHKYSLAVVRKFRDPGSRFCLLTKHLSAFLKLKTTSSRDFFNACGPLRAKPSGHSGSESLQARTRLSQNIVVALFILWTRADSLPTAAGTFRPRLLGNEKSFSPARKASSCFASGPQNFRELDFVVFVERSSNLLRTES